MLAWLQEHEPEVIARYDAAKVGALMANSAIVRNRSKIVGTIASARAYLVLRERQGLADLLWGYVDGRPLRNTFASHLDAPAATPLSTAIAKELKRLGFAFCGPTVVHAFYQACGLVNGHVDGCFRGEECAKLALRHHADRYRVDRSHE